MKEVDRRSEDVATRRLLTRGQVAEVGGSDNQIRARINSGRWKSAQAGVYSIGPLSGDWSDLVTAAVLAAGNGSAASHRTALKLWELEVIRRAPVEVTVPITHGPVPYGVVVHRTRRPIPTEVISGTIATSVERTLLDAASFLPRLMVEKAMEAAIRKQLTSEDKVASFLSLQGGRGVRGTKALRGILSSRLSGPAAGSGGEVEFGILIRKARLPAPQRQWRVTGASGAIYTVDYGWPNLGRKGAELDGLDAHSSATALDSDLWRQNDLLAAGVDLRRYTLRAIRQRPDEVAADLRRFLRG